MSVYDTREAQLAEFCAVRHGVFSAADASTLGFDSRTRTRRVATGRWEQPFPRVYRIAGSPLTWESRVRAGCLAVGTNAYASLRTAASLWGLPGGSIDIVEITTARSRGVRRDGLIIHEWKRELAPSDTTMRDAIPVTSVDVTLLTLGSVVREAVVEQALDVAVNTSLTTMASARATLERLAKRGRNGAATLRAILDRRDPDAATPESPAETRLVRMLVRHGLPTPVVQFEIREGARFIARVDAAYPDRRVAIEYDSYAHHTGRAALVRDATRRNRLAALGWTVVVVTAEDLRTGGAVVAATLRELLRRAS